MCDSLFTELKLDFFSCVLFVPSSFDPSFQDLETYDGRLEPMAIHGHYITSCRTVELQFYITMCLAFSNWLLSWIPMSCKADECC